MPGLDTSSMYSPLIGSSTSSTADTARLMRAQSSTSMPPSGFSAMICSTALLPPISRRRTSSKPSPSIVGVTIAGEPAVDGGFGDRSAKGLQGTKKRASGPFEFRWRPIRDDPPLMADIGAAGDASNRIAHEAFRRVARPSWPTRR